ncbi:MAG: IS66 family insertion sequence element accessory protein TnpB [Oscillospiraceae bacterium]
MLNDFTGADQVYIACGYTDLRKGIDGLARLVQQQFELDPFTNTLFLFCGRRRDQYQGLVLGKRWLYPAVQATGTGRVPMAALRI